MKKLYNTKKSSKMSTNTEVIELFNFLNFQKTLTLNELEANKDYKIDGAYRVSSTFGNTVSLKIDNKMLYLPKRFNFLSDDIIQRLSSGSFLLAKVFLENDNSRYKLELKQKIPFDSFYTSF